MYYFMFYRNPINSERDCPFTDIVKGRITIFLKLLIQAEEIVYESDEKKNIYEEVLL